MGPPVALWVGSNTAERANVAAEEKCTDSDEQYLPGSRGAHGNCPLPLVFSAVLHSCMVCSSSFTLAFDVLSGAALIFWDPTKNNSTHCILCDLFFVVFTVSYNKGED